MYMTEHYLSHLLKKIKEVNKFFFFYSRCHVDVTSLAAEILQENSGPKRF